MNIGESQLYGSKSLQSNGQMTTVRRERHNKTAVELRQSFGTWNVLYYTGYNIGSARISELSGFSRLNDAPSTPEINRRVE